MQGTAAAWERLTHSFGQRRQLPVLAKHVPTERPRLRNTAYEMVGTNHTVCFCSTVNCYHPSLAADV